jgi:hypothetical protein
MTKSTLKALWLGGGGVLATWLAVTPNQSVTPSAPTAGRPVETRTPTAGDLNGQADRLRSRTSAVVLRPSTRNPFRFRDDRAAAPAADRFNASPTPAAVAPSLEDSPPAPRLRLSGVTEKSTPEGARRTAVISGEGQLYLAGVGDTVAGRYSVVAIDPEAVVLRDTTGAEIRLLLR